MVGHLNSLKVRVISSRPVTTHVEWLRLFNQLDRETPKELKLHLIVDNYCIHRHGKVLEWRKKHPRFHMHFTPTSSPHPQGRAPGKFQQRPATGQRNRNLPCKQKGV